MTKYILSVAVISALTLTGCTQTKSMMDSAKSATSSVAKKVTSTVSKTVSDVVDGNSTKVEKKKILTKEELPKGVTVSEETIIVKDTVGEPPLLGESTLPKPKSFTDQVTGKAVDMADEATDGKASLIMDAVK